jgi:hypothetical protein
MDRSQSQIDCVEAALSFDREISLIGMKGFSAKKQNKAADRLFDLTRCLMEQDKTGCPDFFEGLLDHQNSGVRGWAASHLLPFRCRPALRALKIIARGDGMEGFTTRLEIEEWRKGTYDPHWVLSDEPARDYRASWFEKLRRNFHYFTTF